MLISKNVSFLRVLQWSWAQILMLLLTSSGVAALYYFDIVSIKIPWLPISIIGTAVAFFVGFKNNQSYDRMWEARKIWGGIVNNSRTWGMQVDGFVSSIFNHQIDKEEIKRIKKRLIYRHVAWLYTHRNQLLVATNWEHANQTGRTAKIGKYFQDNFGIGLVVDEVSKIKLKDFVPKEELEKLSKAKNKATQIINAQSRELTQLRSKHIIDDFRHVELMETLKQFYELQGKNERIKKFPFPRQYANASNYFTMIFLFLLPFSMVPELMELGVTGFWLSIPVTALISWVYLTMEATGDYSENPFQGMANDIPMLSLCRTIEIDLRQMLNETELPKSIGAKKEILM
ncbi:MAG: hypothetical protein JXR05_16000 [Flavobacteriaceae bacterium]